MNKKPPQSDYWPLRVDTSDVPRRYMLVHEETSACGTDLTASPDYIDRDNQRRAINGDPWRWAECTEAA